MAVPVVTLGQPILESWGDDVADAINNLASNSGYTPTLTGMAIGTGGSASNTGFYAYVGGRDVGEFGLLSLHGSVVFGTSGQTFPTNPTIALPAGFSMVSSDNLRPIGLWLAVDASTGANNRNFAIFAGSATTLRPLNAGFAAATATLTTTTPFTWASSDAIHWSVFGIPVVRV